MKLRKRFRKIINADIFKVTSAVNGVLDYVASRERLQSQGGPFNRQQERAKIFSEMVAVFRPSSIVETGTFRGKTTDFMKRETNLSVHTVEIELRFFIYDWLKFRREPLINVHYGDSRTFLNRLSYRKEILGMRPFFYLDAHWRDDLPLRDEIEVVLVRWPQAVIMVDDFQVPDDEGYGFDDYGEGKILNLDYIRGIGNLAMFFPRQPSALESGAKRGCVVLARSSDTAEALRRVTSLREFGQ